MSRRHRISAWGVFAGLLLGGGILAACSAASSQGGSPGDAAAEASEKTDGGTAPGVDAGGKSGDGGSVDSGADVSHVDATTKDATADGSADASIPEAGSSDAPFDLDGFDVIVVGPPDTGTVPEASPDAPVLNACGICDRTWVCNGFSDHWVSTGADSCGDDRNGHIVTTLFCETADTIGFADPVNNYGTWAMTSTGLALYFDGLQGTMEIDCVP